MVIYKCAKCGFKTANKRFFEAHIRRSKHIQPSSDTEQKPVIAKITEVIESGPVPEIVEKKSRRRKYAEIMEENSTESEELENE